MPQENIQRSSDIFEILKKNHFLNYEIGLAIIDLNSPTPEIFGYNMDHFIYPASVYKIFIGAEVLRQVEVGILSLEQLVEIQSPNDVDKNPAIFPGDNRPLLVVGQKVSIDTLLNLMLTRSDNTASNTLIDLVTRESINTNIIEKYNWNGSGITRKFLDRKKEDAPYRFSETTLSCARHIAEFFYLVEKKQLTSPFVSNKLKEYMSKWNRTGRTGLYIPAYKTYYRKGGWLETNLYTHNIFSAIKSILQKGWAMIQWSNDAGVVKTEKSDYVISFFSINKTINPYKKFPMQKLARVIYKYMGY